MKYAIVFGLLLLFFGFGYSLVHTGVPYPDPTPLQEEAWNFHSLIGSAISWTGMGVFFIGAIGWLLGKFPKKKSNANF